MVATSFTALRRLAGSAFALILLCLCLPGAAIGQAPAVTASAPAGLSHPTGWSTIQQTAIDSNGNWIVVDFAKAAMYEFPAGGGPAITLVAPGGLADTYGNPNALLDPSNNLFIGGDYNNCLLMIPYGSAANPWPGLSQMTTTTPSKSYCYTNNGVSGKHPGMFPDFMEGFDYLSYSPYYMQPWGMTLYTGPGAPTSVTACAYQNWVPYNCTTSSTTVSVAYNLVFGIQNSGNAVYSIPVTLDNSINDAAVNGEPIAVPFSTTEIIAGLKKRAISMASDPWGNVYFVEDSGGNPGVIEIPEATMAAAYAAGSNHGPIADETGLTRVDPNLSSVMGVVTDSAGNLYISDSQQGVVMVPNNAGTPETASAVWLTPVPATAEVAIDPDRKLIYVPTNQKQNNGQSDVAMVGIGSGELGSSPVGTATANSLPVDFYFNSTVTPANFVIVEDGMASPEFSITGGTCVTGTAYDPQSSCYESVSYTPTAVGSSSAKLLMLDSNNKVLASMNLHGTGVGSLAQAAPGVESTIGSNLSLPFQVAVDASGNVFVADPDNGVVFEYAGGSGTGVPVNTGTVSLDGPTGVAVDGAGDLFIGDDTGIVYEIPFGPNGLNAANIVQLATGLGGYLNLAADGTNNVYVADPNHGQIVKLAGVGDSSYGSPAQSAISITAGLSAPYAVAVDSNSNLYILDESGNLLELVGGVSTPISSSHPTSAPTILLNGVNANGVAVDSSGAVYLATSGGTLRVPVVSGSVGAPTIIAPDLASTYSVALDRWGNIYLVNPGVTSVTRVSTTAALNNMAPATTQDATVTNIGNAALSISGYTDYSFVLDSVTITNFTGADGTCLGTSPIPAGDSCQVAVTFAPEAGQQGALTGWVKATSNAVNSPITIDASGTAAPLADSKTQVTVGSNPQVINTPLTVTVTPASGTGTPTGTVQVSYTSWTVVVPTNCSNPPCAPTINPVTVTQSSTLTNGQAQFTLAPVLAGNETFTVGYTGDRTYGSSTGTATANVAKSAIAGFIADKNPPPYLPFVEQSSAVTPYDGTNQYWTYSMPVTVNTAIGIPTGTITFNDNSTTCPPGTSASGVGAATCALANYSGVSCPAQNGAAVQFVVNNGSPSPNAGGSASFLTSCLQMPQFTTYVPVVSTHYITPVYSGDANFTGATDPVSTLFQVLTGPLVNITPTAPAAPSAPISAASLSVASGSTANLTLYLAPLLGYGFQGKGGTLNDYNFPVTLTCDNLPPHTACTFSYPSVTSAYQPSAPNSAQICPQPTLDSNSDTAAAFETLAENGGCNANGVGVVTLTINTNVTVGTTTTSQNATAASLTLASLFGVGMIGLFVRRRAFEKARRVMMVILMVVGGALAVTLSACNTTNLSGLAQLSTPPGTYAVSITASQVGTQCVPQVGGSTNCTTASGGTGRLVAGSNNHVSLPYYIKLTVQ